jgi:hypothetical protein
MNKQQLIGHLERLDRALRSPAVLCVYGSAAGMLLDQPDRTSLDIDIAGPYSQADLADLAQAATAAGVPLNPDEQYGGDHLEWIPALRLCLPKPEPETDMLLWQGRRLTVKTVAAARLVASKLIRYDEIDQSDIQFLCRQARVRFEDVAAAVDVLPPPFDQDTLVRENLRYLESDMRAWSLP